MTAEPHRIMPPASRASRFMRKALPYLLSLPALLVCIGILIPFFTAVIYSLQRYRLNLPWRMRGFIWFDNYINFLTDPDFWNTLKISLIYAGLTVGARAAARPWHRAAAAEARRASTTSSRSCCCCR